MTTPIEHVQFLAAIIAKAQSDSEVESEFTIAKGEIFIKMKRNEDVQLHMVEKIINLDNKAKAAFMSTSIYEFLNPD